MRQTNNAIKFLIAQYRAIFNNANLAMAAKLAKSSAMAAKATALAAAVTVSAAHAAAGDAALESDEWAQALVDGKGTISITGEASDVGGSGKFKTITLSGSTNNGTTLTLDAGQKLVIDGEGAADANTIKAGGAGAKLTLQGKGEIVVGGSNSGTTLRGLTLEADSGSLALDVSKLTVQSTLDIKTNDQAGALAKVGAEQIFLGDGKFTAGANPEGLALVKVGAAAGSGSITFGSALSEYQIKEDAQLVITPISGAASQGFVPGTTVDGHSARINGVVTVESGAAGSHAYYNVRNTTFDGGIMAVKSGALATVDLFDSNNYINFTNGSHFVLGDNLNVAKGSVYISNDSVMASSGDTGMLTLGIDTDQNPNSAYLIISAEKLSAFLTGKVNKTDPLKFKDESKIFGDNAASALTAAGSGAISIKSGGTLYITGKDEEPVDLSKFTFATSDTAGAISSNGDGLVRSVQIAIPKALTNASKINAQAWQLILGSEDFDSSTAALGVKAMKAQHVIFVPAKGATAYTLLDKIELSTDSSGEISGSVNIGSASSGGHVYINVGTYYFDENGGDIIVKSGSGTDNVGLKLQSAWLIADGKFETTKDTGKVLVDTSGLDLSNATLKLDPNTISMKGFASLRLDGSKVIKLTDTQGDLVQLQNGLSANSISGDVVSNIVLEDLTSMTMEQFKELKQDFSGFRGTWEGFKIAGEAPKTNDDLANIETGISGYYDKTQVNVSASTNISDNYNVGSLKISDGNSVSISGGFVTLTNAQANGGKYFVTAQDGSLGSVKLNGSGDFLMLKGDGAVGQISTATASQGGLIVGGELDTSIKSNVSVQGNIGAEDKHLHAMLISPESNVSVDGDVYVRELGIFKNAKLSMPNNTLVVGKGTVEAVEYAEVYGSIDAKDMVIEGVAGILFAGGGTVDVGSLSVTSDQSNMQIGQDGEEGLGATVIAGTFDLGGAKVFVDPDFNAEASQFVIGQLKDSTLNGKAIVGKNAILAIGFDRKDEVTNILSQYLDENGAFRPGSAVQNAVVLNQGITLGATDKVIIDPKANLSSFTNAAVDLGSGSALVITDKAYKVVNGQKQGYAIKMADPANNAVDASKGGSVILSGKFNAGDKGITVFSGARVDAGTTGGLAIRSANGLINGTIGNDGSVFELKLDADKLATQMASISAPVRDLYGKLLGADGDKYLNGSGVGAELLTTIGTDSMTGVEADAAAHGATYAGAQVAAVAAVGTMAEAIGGRVGAAGVESSTISGTGSTSAGGVWLSPMYKTIDADGFAAQGASYGADVDLAGVAFGADSVNGNLRFGAVFNIGSGDADGKGNGSGLKNEFDYYGVGIYSAMNFGQLNVLADASFSIISHDVKGYSGLESFGDLTAKADTTAVTMGVTGQYTIATPMADVVPHLGMRFTRLDTDSYDMASAKGVVSSTDFDVQNVISIPVGVSVSKTLEMGGWTLAPSADLTITFNSGDTEAKQDVKFTGITENLALSTEVLDEVTYGLSVGVGAQYGAFGTSVGLNYVGSENTDSIGVSAQARYAF